MAGQPAEDNADNSGGVNNKNRSGWSCAMQRAAWRFPLTIRREEILSW